MDLGFSFLLVVGQVLIPLWCGLAGLLLLLFLPCCCSIGFGGSGSQVDSARMNLASSFVNGFVNAAFGQDKLLTDDGNKWLYKNKDHGELASWAGLEVPLGLGLATLLGKGSLSWPMSLATTSLRQGTSVQA